MKINESEHEGEREAEALLLPPESLVQTQITRTAVESACAVTRRGVVSIVVKLSPDPAVGEISETETMTMKLILEAFKAILTMEQEIVANFIKISLGEGKKTEK